MQISNLSTLGPGGVLDQAVSSVKVPASNTATVVSADNSAPVLEAPQDAQDFQEVLNREVSAQAESDEAGKIQYPEEDEKTVEEKEDGSEVDAASLSLMSATQLILTVPTDSAAPLDGGQALGTVDPAQNGSVQWMNVLDGASFQEASVSQEGLLTQAVAEEQTEAQATMSVEDVLQQAVATLTEQPVVEDVSAESNGSKPDSSGVKDTISQETKNLSASVSPKAAEPVFAQSTVPAEEISVFAGSTAAVRESEPQQKPAVADALAPIQATVDEGSKVQVQSIAQTSTGNVNVQVQDNAAREEVPLEQAGISKNVSHEALATKLDTPLAALQLTTPVAQQQAMPEAAPASSLDAGETRRVISDIVNKIHVSIGEKVHETQIELKPDFLGRMNIRLSVEGDRVSMRLQVANASVRELVESNFSSLRDSLRERGFTMDTLQVSVNAQGHDFNPSQQQATANPPVAVMSQSASGFAREQDSPDAFAVSGIREEFAFADTESINYLI